MKRRKRRKDVCKCGKKLILNYDDCVYCGGGEHYECNKCGRIYDLNGKEL